MKTVEKNAISYYKEHLIDSEHLKIEVQKFTKDELKVKINMWIYGDVICGVKDCKSADGKKNYVNFFPDCDGKDSSRTFFLDKMIRDITNCTLIYNDKSKINNSLRNIFLSYLEYLEDIDGYYKTSDFFTVNSDYDTLGILICFPIFREFYREGQDLSKTDYSNHNYLASDIRVGSRKEAIVKILGSANKSKTKLMYDLLDFMKGKKHNIFALGRIIRLIVDLCGPDNGRKILEEAIKNLKKTGKRGGFYKCDFFNYEDFLQDARMFFNGFSNEKICKFLSEQLYSEDSISDRDYTGRYNYQTGGYVSEEWAFPTYILNDSISMFAQFNHDSLMVVDTSLKTIKEIHDDLARKAKRIKEKPYELQISKTVKEKNNTIIKIKEKKKEIEKFKFIVPIMSDELNVWSEKMNNCIASYKNRCKGTEYVFAILDMRDNMLYNGQVKSGRLVTILSKCNQGVPKDDREIILDFMKKEQLLN